MKRDFLKRMVLAAAATIPSILGVAQTSESDNSASFPTSFTGWDAASFQPLRVMHNGNFPLQFWTDSLHRMQLFHTMPPATINGFPNIARNGYLGISPAEAFYTNPGPFSRLHLVDSGATAVNYAQDFGWRPWMRNGVTMTGNSDQMYIGHKYTYVDSSDYTSGEINDRSDAVIEWSDNPDDAPWGTDRLRFMFTNDYNVAAPADFGARSLEGMEAMRIYIPTDTTAHVGIGDFFRAGVVNGQNEDPTERLHVRDGRVRIQELPDNTPADSDYVVMVVDTTASPSGERGVVKWVPASSIVSVADCEWSMTPGVGSGVNDVWTAVGGLVDNCPDVTEAVGIGTSAPLAKLHIATNLYSEGVRVENTAAQTATTGESILVSGGTAVTRGLEVANTGTGVNGVGAILTVTGATSANQGLVAIVGGSGANNIGANLATSGGTASNVGMRAVVSGASVTNTGDQITVSGGTAANIGDLITVSGAAANNTGISLTTTGATGSNTGVSATVTGASTANAGGLFSATGSTTSNIGTNVNATGAATANVGASVRTTDATDNRGVHIRASTSANSALNYGIKIDATTANETSEDRGVHITLSGTADRGRGVDVENYLSNSGSSTNSSNYGGYFTVYGTGFLYSNGVIGDSYGAPAGNGFSRGVVGRTLGGASRNAGVLGANGTFQPLDRDNSSFGVFGHNQPTDVRTNVGTAGYISGAGSPFPKIGGRTGVAGICRPTHDTFNAGALGYVGPNDPGTWPNGTFGVYGRSQDTSWAGFFDGNVNVNGNIFLNSVFFASDENLKENIEMLPGAMAAEVIGQLDPVSYTFSEEAQQSLALPEGEQVGLIAQQVQQVLPSLVKQKIQPALQDTMGNIVQPELSILTVNYVGMIPYLIADNKRLQERLDVMQEQIAACCAAGTDPRSTSKGGSTELLETDLRIIPNPVADQTELRYTVGAEGRVRLEITDASGRMIQTQDEGVRSTGTYSYGWDTTLLAPGTYHCTLYVDDERLVEKAVKLNER